MKRKLLISTTAILLLLTANQLKAQPFSLDKNIKPKEISLKKIELQTDSLFNGMMGLLDTIQKMDTAYYFVKGAGIYQPVYFAYTSADKADNSQIFLCKNNWKKPDRTSTLQKGKWSSIFKTEGSFGIMVVQKKNKPKYNLLVWIGKEPKNIVMPSPFKSQTKK